MLCDMAFLTSSKLNLRKPIDAAMAALQWFTTLARRTWFRVALGLTLGYVLFGIFGIPWLIRHYTPPAVTRLVQRPLSLGKVTFNPVLFRLDARDLALTETDGARVFAIRRLYLDFEVFRSLLNRAPTFAELRLEGPSVNLVQDQAGVLNMAKIVASLPPDDPAPQPDEDAPPPRLVLRHIEFLDGEIAFENQAESPPVVNRAEHLDLELTNISTLPERSGLYEIEAALPGGGTLRWQGDMSLNPVASQGRLEVTALKLATLLDIAGDRLDLAEPEGVMDFSARYRFNRTKTDARVSVDEALVKVTGLGLAMASRQMPLAELEEFRAGPFSLDLTEQTIGIPSITLRRGKVHLARNSDGQLNWLTLLKAAPVQAPPPVPSTPQAAEPPAEPWKVTVGEFGIAELGLDYADSRPNQAAKAVIGDIGLSLKAEAVAGGVEPPVVRIGEFGLRLKDIGIHQEQTELLRLADISLDEASLDLPGQTLSVPRLAVNQGRISAAFNEAGQLNWLRLAPAAEPVAGTPPDLTAAPAAGTPPAQPWQLKLGQFSLAGIALDFADARVQPVVQAAVGEFGLSLTAEATVGGGSAPIVQIGEFGLHLKDIGLNQAQHALLALENLSLEQASLALPEQQIRVPSISVSKGRISASMDAAGRLDWQALVPARESEGGPPAPAPDPATDPPARPWQVSVDHCQLGALALDYADASRKAPIKASVGDFGLNFKAEALAGAGPFQATIEQVAAHIDRFAARDTQADQPLLEWDSLRLEEGRADLARQEVSLRRLTLKGGGAGVSREADGAIHPISLFAVEAPEEPIARPPPASAPSRPWLFKLGEMAVSGFAIGVRDRSLAMPLAYDFDDLNVSVKDLANAGKAPIRFDARTKISQGGALALSGTAAPSGDSAQASLKLDHVNLDPLQGFISDFAKLQLDTADLSADLALGFRQAKPKPEIRVTGGASLANLKLTQSTDGKKFLAWRDLSTKGIDFSLAPDKLSIKELRLIEPDAVIAIHEDKSSNISDVIKSQPAAPKPAVAAPTRSAKSGKAGGKAPTAKTDLPVSIGRILVEKGRVDFSDLSLVLPFATRVHALGGAVAGLALAPGGRATVQLTGRVDDYGEARVEGSLSPMEINRYSDINVIFRNIAMSSLSPYSATFAGRKIESGKLDLDLQYKIEDSQLRSTYAITLNRFRLGEAVESPHATSLPLDLAISLLTDSEGKIQASVPIEGRVDDPQFDYASVVGDALVALITNVVKAPFNALASMVGLDGEGDPGSVAFDPGQAEIPPPEREKLQKLARGLVERPTLKLIVHGGYDPKADAQALKSMAVRQAVAEELDVVLAPGETPDAVNVSDAASQRALEKLAGRMGGADRVVTAYARETGHPPQRVGPMAGLFGEPSETPAFYEMLLADLVERTPLPQKDLDALAERRGRAVLKELIERQRFDRSRATMGKPGDTQATADQRIAIRLELTLQ